MRGTTTLLPAEGREASVLPRICVRDGTRVEITIAAAAWDGTLELTVTDSGPALSAERRARLFVPGFTTKTHGSGLGLTIVRQIVERHHGRVQLVSEVGRGSTFVLWFPTLEPPTPDTGPVPVVSAVPEGTARV